MDAQEIKDINQQGRERTLSNKKKKLTQYYLNSKMSYEQHETVDSIPKRFANNVKKQEKWIEYNSRKNSSVLIYERNHLNTYERKKDRKKNRIVLKDSCQKTF